MARSNQDEFDGYRKWLGITNKKRLPTHYELLTISLDEDDPEVIHAAAEQRRRFVESKRGDGHDGVVTEILYRIDEAETVLLNSEMRREYDRQHNLFDKRRRNRQVDPIASRSRFRSRPGRTVGEDSGILRTFIGIMIVVCAGFGGMAWFSFQLPWFQKGADKQPAFTEGHDQGISDVNATSRDGASEAGSPDNLVQVQVKELRSKLTKWQGNQQKLKQLIESLEEDRSTLLGKLSQLTHNKSDGEKSPEAQVLATELGEIGRQSDSCKGKLKEYDLAILKTESKLRSIERQIAVSEAGVSETDLTELAATVMELDESLSDQETVSSIADVLDNRTSKMLDEFRAEQKSTEQANWEERVANLPASRQVDEVGKKLVELNPGFDGKLETKIVGGAIVELSLVTDRVSDISPLTVLKELTSVSLRGSSVDWNTRSGTGKVSDIRPLKGMRLTNLDLVFNPIEDISVIEGMPLAVLDIAFALNIRDISVVRGMQLVRFQCQDTNVTDLSPLAGMKLQHINIVHTPISSLEPLRGMPLEFVNAGETRISSLDPLRESPIKALILYSTKVSDLEATEKMPLKNLNIHMTDVSDLSPLSRFKLEEFIFSPERISSGLDFVRDMKSIKRISDVTWSTESPDVFWRRLDAGKNYAAIKTLERNETLSEISQAVVAKLKKLNEGFNGEVKETIEDGMVVGLEFLTDNVTDISPLREMRDLKTLRCIGSAQGKGLLADLSPLQGLSLVELECYFNPVRTLNPLSGMPLQRLWCSYSSVSDLTPLTGMPLNSLNLHTTLVTDLTPIRDCPLTELNVADTPVSNISVLKGMKLNSLFCERSSIADISPLIDMPLSMLDVSKTTVVDLSPIKNLPLTWLHCEFRPERDADIVRSIKSLVTINEKPVEDFWKGLDNGNGQK